VLFGLVHRAAGHTIDALLGQRIRRVERARLRDFRPRIVDALARGERNPHPGKDSLQRAHAQILVGDGTGVGHSHRR
jgi:hypothetical protein